MSMERSRELLEEIFDESTDAIFLVDSVSLLTLDCNRRAVELFEAESRQELIGIEGHTLQKQPFSPTQIDSIVEEIQRKGYWGLELEYITKQGNSFWGNLSVKQIRANGEIIHLVRVTDISELKQLDKEKELQAFITRNIAEGICLVRANDGIIVYTNSSFDQLFGYAPEELPGQHISIINYGYRSHALHISRQIISNILIRGEYTYEIRNVKKDGTPFWSHATATVFRHLDYGIVFVVVQQDITQLKQKEDQIQRSLREKEILLKEIHHRVKNNLQIISSLIQMQLRRTPNPETANILLDSQSRINAIAIAHEKLYRSDDLAQIDLSRYIPSLISSLMDTFQSPTERIELSIDIDSIISDIDTAITCSLIINELFSNALKYAFPASESDLSCALTNSQAGDFRKKGARIEVKLQASHEGIVRLTLRDNGIGISPKINIESTSSLGLKLVQALVEQLTGSIQIHRYQGTCIEIQFPYNDDQEHHASC